MERFNLPLFAGVIFLVLPACNKIEQPSSDITYPVAYVVNGENNSISLIDLNTEERVETCQFKKGSWPHHISTNKANDKLLVSLVGADLSAGHAGHGTGEESFLMLLRASDLKVLGCVKTDYPAHNAIFVKNDAEIWVPQMTEEGFVLRLDAKNLKELGTIQAGNGPLEITADVNAVYAFIANGEANTVSIIKTETAELVKTLNVGDEPVGAWPAANNKMYVDCEISKEVYEIDVTTLSITDTIALGFTPAYVVYNSGLSELWVSDAQNGGVHTYNLVSGNWTETAFLYTGNNAHAIAFNADETKAYITNQGADNVSIIDATAFTKLKDIAVGSKPNGILIRY